MTDEPIEREELRAFRLMLRTWLANNIPAIGSFNPEDEEDPSPERLTEIRGTQGLLYEAGYAGFTFPVEYGGQGLTLDHERIFMQEATGYDLPTRFFGISINILGMTLAHFGTPGQKLSHIRNILAGEERWLQLLSEPSGGSDLAGLLTAGVRDGDSFIVNGQKIWSSGAHLGDYALCAIRTRWDLPKHKGITVLIVDLKSPGIEIRRIKQIDGRKEFCEVFLTGVIVPAANTVGEENEGWTVVRGLLQIEHAWAGRGGYPTNNNLGVDPLVALVKSRGLALDPGVRRQIVGLHVATKVQHLVSARLSRGMELGRLSAAYGSLLKLGNDIVEQRSAELGLNLAGPEGVVWSSKEPTAAKWSDDYLYSRGTSIAGGTDEIQRNNASERVLGLPRERSTDHDVPFNQVPHN